MQHCIVSLYRSVSKREKMPSGKSAVFEAIRAGKAAGRPKSAGARLELPIAVDGGVVG
jgi:hypothetical protein